MLHSVIVDCFSESEIALQYASGLRKVLPIAYLH